MPEEKLEEETYSLIFTSLKHPIRRRILRMLANGQMTFSEILNSLSIDSGHLSYHLENLGELLTRSQDGKYGLSSIGAASVKLMSGVEEHPAAPSNRGFRMMRGFINLYVLILVVALVAASLWFTAFIAQSSGGGFGTGPPGIAILLKPNQTYEYNFTIVFLQGAETKSYIHEDNFIYEERPPPINTLTEWETGQFWLMLESNETFDILATIFSPENPAGDVKTITETNWVGPGAPSVLFAEITQAGSYKFTVKNIGSKDLQASVRVNERWSHFEKPYLYLGIAGIFLVLLYPVSIAVSFAKGTKLHS